VPAGDKMADHVGVGDKMVATKWRRVTKSQRVTTCQWVTKWQQLTNRSG